jgi:2-polyprenyl-6-methoxyphenol hydroxylase-like FAD-dependent oxidoreductase
MDSIPDIFEHETPICIVGGGPVGMLTAIELSRLGVDCLLAEINTETTKWPKMDMTNSRSMEILRMMGIGHELRSQKGAIPSHHQWDSIFYTSCSEGGRELTRWVSCGLEPKEHRVR